MDINLDAVPTNSTGSEPISPQVITPVPSTTSSITWPSEYSGVSSHALPSNSSAIVTSSLNSPSVAASVSMVSQQYSKSSLKNNLHRNNNTSRSSTGYLKDETLQTTRTDNNAPDSKDSLNTKGIRKRYILGCFKSNIRPLKLNYALLLLSAITITINPLLQRPA